MNLFVIKIQKTSLGLIPGKFPINWLGDNSKSNPLLVPNEFFNIEIRVCCGNMLNNLWYPHSTISLWSVCAHG